MSPSNPAAQGGESSTTRQPPAGVKRFIDECARASHAATISFPEVIGRLASVGVESYFADFRHSTTTYYLASGESHGVPLHTPDGGVPETFDAPAIIDAILGSQRGEVEYPDFVRRAMAAGCIGYFVWIAGRHVRYLGRRGEDHVERFPS